MKADRVEKDLKAVLIKWHILLYTVVLVITANGKLKAQYLQPYHPKDKRLEEFKDFYKSIFQSFKYPDQLRDSCIGTYANILVQVSDKGKLTEIKLSDSAPFTLMREFNAQKYMLNLRSLQLLADRKKDLRGNSIIIPLIYHLVDEKCNTAFVKLGDLVTRLNEYNGKPYEGLGYYLPPYILEIYPVMKKAK